MPIALTTDDGDLLLVLLTGGGLALLGTVLGALITQVFAAAAARQSRSEARRVALKSFQRDTLVALQDNIVAMDVVFDELRAMRRSGDQGDAAEQSGRPSEYHAAASHVAMLASRIRDTELREAVKRLLAANDKYLNLSGKIVPADIIRDTAKGTSAVVDRAGHLIRTMDELEEAETNGEAKSDRG